MEQKQANKGRTEIATPGEYGWTDHLMADTALKNKTTLLGVGDDAAAVAAGKKEAVVCTTDLLLEGIDFDLTYFPLRHLGYKAVTVGVCDILAMNACPEQLMLSIGVSSKLPVEAGRGVGGGPGGGGYKGLDDGSCPPCDGDGPPGAHETR